MIPPWVHVREGEACHRRRLMIDAETREERMRAQEEHDEMPQFNDNPEMKDTRAHRTARLFNVQQDALRTIDRLCASAALDHSQIVKNLSDIGALRKAFAILCVLVVAVNLFATLVLAVVVFR